MNRNQVLTITAALLTLALFPIAVASAQTASFERPPIDYLNAEVNDDVAKLAAEIASGERELKYHYQHGYLPAVLEALDVPVSSQTLVFSKTSLQLHRISPNRPRALYFNDNVYIGFCQRGDVLELAVTDPQQGAIFYTLKQSRTDQPKFVRDRGQCLTCHASSRTQNVPGYLIRSVYSDRSGQPMLGSGTFTTDHTSPFKERWGGWYVTGTHGDMRHMGNLTCESDEQEIDFNAGANKTTLDGIVSTKPYLSEHSDIVALMVLEHQTQMHNAIAAANYETREALHQSYTMNKLLEREPDHISESAERRMTKAAERVVTYLLMCEEFPLTDKVAGTSEFAEDFAQRGIKDSKGRSLRDFDLSKRLFRYPCSYLIYSDAFENLPEAVYGRVIGRLTEILDGRDTTGDYAHLTATDRQAIKEILTATHPAFQKEPESSAESNGGASKATAS